MKSTSAPYMNICYRMNRENKKFIILVLHLFGYKYYETGVQYTLSGMNYAYMDSSSTGNFPFSIKMEITVLNFCSSHPLFRHLL